MFASIFLFLLSSLTDHIDSFNSSVEVMTWILTTMLVVAMHLGFIVAMLRRLRWAYVAFIVLAAIALVAVCFVGRDFNPKRLMLDAYLTGASDVVDLLILILLLQKPSRSWFFSPKVGQAAPATVASGKPTT